MDDLEQTQDEPSNAEGIYEVDQNILAQQISAQQQQLTNASR